MEQYYIKLLIRLFISYLKENGLSDMFANNIMHHHLVRRADVFFKKQHIAPIHPRNVFQMYLPEIIKERRIDFLNSTIAWDKTPEGWDFWYEKHRKSLYYIAQGVSHEEAMKISNVLRVNLLQYR